MKRCVVGIRRPSDPESPPGKETPTVWFPSMAAVLSEDNQSLLRLIRDRRPKSLTEQAEGENLYWPSYNLDINNPHARAGQEHADPKDLIGAMPSHEADVMRLLGEIEALVAEVQA
ncbi:hypothetical protein [Achromobacter animicus]|uniref:hypothetical protein n=1 Tax=Achromobacter animicus TaxID=1389935 RepID=UPI00244CCE77|nr:hypothetical protein [Achromobacter animicus]MDH0681780.1 hypothetical protein [Achromobacter animicus]